MKQILTNEKYMGDALLQKTYTVDFLNKKRIKNDGAVPQYYVENSHEAIIPKDIFLQVQEQLKKRSSKNKRCHSSLYVLTNKVKCSNCGNIYRRVTWKNRGQKEVVWRCLTRIEKGPESCHAETIKEEILHNKILEAINNYSINQKELLGTLQKNIESVLGEDSKKEIEKLEEKMYILQNELVDFAKKGKDYAEPEKELRELRTQKQNIILKSENRRNIDIRLRVIQEYLEEIGNQGITEYSDDLVKRLIDKIEINREKLTVEFKDSKIISI
ncbi:recombinase zinc beta ribbon domain-containing protein [Gemella sp. 19428wG2_WT2a]|nr:recombinase zinc beta ribbon domain-containing protein [Gemella sp. 19428wG2_WT2a]TFU60130.1 hypothetical protein E4T67_01450 [Gemella sp. WT2a]